MSQFDPNAGSHSDFGRGQSGGTNVLGIVGFVLAWCTGPIGLLISLVALAKKPRGFAIAGVIVGLITTAVLIFIIISGGAFFGGVMKGMKLAQTFDTINSELGKNVDPNTNSYPDSLVAAGLDPSLLDDPWGTPLRYELIAGGRNFLLTSAGPDGAFGTSDDIRLNRFVNSGLAMIAVGGSGVMGMLGESARTEIGRGMQIMIDMASIDTAVTAHRTATGAYPGTLGEVDGLGGPLLVDPFGNEYIYAPSTDGASFTLISKGPDGIQGTDDDISLDDMRDAIDQGRRQRLPGN